MVLLDAKIHTKMYSNNLAIIVHVMCVVWNTHHEKGKIALWSVITISFFELAFVVALFIFKAKNNALSLWGIYVG